LNLAAAKEVAIAETGGAGRTVTAPIAVTGNIDVREITLAPCRNVLRSIVGIIASYPSPIDAIRDDCLLDRSDLWRDQ
jgi:hypothetical protein